MMNALQIYIGISIVTLTIIAILVFVVRKNKETKRLTPLAGLSFAFVLAGLFFRDERLIGYGLMGIGVILAIIDVLRKFKSN